MTEKLSIAMVASESFPFAKVGGLGDAVPALARALARQGLEVRLFLPHYRGRKAAAAGTGSSSLGEAEVSLGAGDSEIARFQRESLPGSDVEVVLVGSRRFFDREGIYDDPETGEGYADNVLRFAFFQRAVVEALRMDDFRPRVLHVHDHQAALIPLMLRHDGDHPCGDCASLLTIHNLGYQGIYPLDHLPSLGLPEDLARPMGDLEFHGSLNFLKAGILSAGLINTVSPRYAREIQSPELGAGLEGVLAQRRDDLIGILNGADYDNWDPRRDSHLAAAYDPDATEGKAACRRALLEEMGLQEAGAEVPVLGFVGRLARQKGLDLLADILPRLLDTDLRLVLLGTGEKDLEERFAEASKRYRGKVAAALRYDEGLAHRITAGADILLMPSIYEPCGLNQLYALRYGTLPVVRETGGLADTIQDLDDDPEEGNGFLFQEPRPPALLGAILRALSLRRNQPLAWERALRRAMRQEFSWDRAASSYRKAYERALARSATST